MNAPSETFSKDYADCYVAFLDILGFKNISLSHSHEHLKSIYRKFSEAIVHGLSNDKYILSKSGETEDFGPDIRQATVNSLLVSDSILIYTDDNSVASFGNILKAVRSLLAFSMIQGIPLRGAISIGPLTLVLNQWPSQTHNFQHSLFGKSIIDAVEAEKKQEWSGCEITKAAIEFYKSECSDGESLLKNKLILLYPIPRKDDKEVGYVIDWVSHPQIGINNQTVEDAFAPSINSDQDKWKKEVEPKLKNTLKFLEHVQSSQSVLGFDNG